MGAGPWPVDRGTDLRPEKDFSKRRPGYVPASITCLQVVDPYRELEGQDDTASHADERGMQQRMVEAIEGSLKNQHQV
jgi:hypothetical protein